MSSEPGSHRSGQPVRRGRRRSGARDGQILELSFGGVVVRGSVRDGTAEMVAIVPRGKDALALPKGGAEAGETPQETARREVREETGIVGEPRGDLGDVTYWYRRDGRRVRKTVRFFLFAYAGGTTADHDHEVTDARWIPLEDAPALLTYPGERRVAERARSALADFEADR